MSRTDHHMEKGTGSKPLDMITPVLPWGLPSGHASSPTTIRDNPDNLFPGLSASETVPQLSPGQRIRWWGATVTEPTVVNQTDVTSNNSGYIINYDAYQDFPQESARIIVLSKDELQHEGSKDTLCWRFEAPAGDCSDTEIDDDMEDTVEMSEILEDAEELERELGTSVEEATMAGLGNLEPCQQVRLVAGFREFSDHIRDALREKMQASGGSSYTVTADDVHAILKGFQKH